MKVARSVAEILSEHTTLALECIDRLYLNVYVPVLQRADNDRLTRARRGVGCSGSGGSPDRDPWVRIRIDLVRVCGCAR